MISTHYLAAAAISASLKIIAGLLPPSSSDTLFKFDSAAIMMIFFPVATDPVNDSFLIFICRAIAAPVGSP